MEVLVVWAGRFLFGTWSRLGSNFKDTSRVDSSSFGSGFERAQGGRVGAGFIMPGDGLLGFPSVLLSSALAKILFRQTFLVCPGMLQ